MSAALYGAQNMIAQRNISPTWPRERRMLLAYQRVQTMFATCPYTPKLVAFARMHSQGSSAPGLQAANSGGPPRSRGLADRNAHAASRQSPMLVESGVHHAGNDWPTAERDGVGFTLCLHGKVREIRYRVGWPLPCSWWLKVAETSNDVHNASVWQAWVLVSVTCMTPASGFLGVWLHRRTCET